jgi:hypothetical protein
MSDNIEKPVVEKRKFDKSEYNKKYNSEHTEYFKKYWQTKKAEMRTKVKCDVCNDMISKGSLRHHVTTKRHIRCAEIMNTK